VPLVHPSAVISAATGIAALVEVLAGSRERRSAQAQAAFLP
jgi:hypothetical protein